MRIEPISLYTGGVSLGGSVSPVGRVKPVNYAKQPEMIELHKSLFEQSSLCIVFAKLNISDLL